MYRRPHSLFGSLPHRSILPMMPPTGVPWWYAAQHSTAQHTIEFGMSRMTSLRVLHNLLFMWRSPPGFLGGTLPQQTIGIGVSRMITVGQNHIHMVYIRHFWQGHHQIYGHIRCVHKRFWPTLRMTSLCVLHIHYLCDPPHQSSETVCCAAHAENQKEIQGCLLCRYTQTRVCLICYTQTRDIKVWIKAVHGFRVKV